jgi:hypothetical protein
MIIDVQALGGTGELELVSQGDEVAQLQDREIHSCLHEWFDGRRRSRGHSSGLRSHRPPAADQLHAGAARSRAAVITTFSFRAARG